MYVLKTGFCVSSIFIRLKIVRPASIARVQRVMYVKLHFWNSFDLAGGGQLGIRGSLNS